MKSLINRLFAKSARSKNAGISRKNPDRKLRAESLERREMMTVNYLGGGVLPHVQAQAVYLGSDWSTNQTANNAARVNERALNSLVTGSYLQMLTSAGYGVGSGSSSRGVIDNLSINKQYYLTDSAIRNDLESLVYHGQVQGNNANRLYVVYVEPGVAVKNDHDNNSTSIKNFAGYHGAFTGYDSSGRATAIHYAVIVYPGGYNATHAHMGLNSDQDFLTAVTSHEVAEAVTDPNVNYTKLGWYDQQNNGEIGDLAAFHYVSLNGYAVQMEVNRADQLIAPAGATYYSSPYSIYSHSASTASQFAGASTVSTLDVNERRSLSSASAIDQVMLTYNS